MKILFVLAVVLITCTQSYSHSDLFYFDGKPMLLHLNSAPLYYNPAFAGTAGKARLSVNSKIINDFKTANYHFSYDQLIDPIHAGVGLIIYKTDRTDFFQFQSQDSFKLSVDTVIFNWNDSIYDTTWVYQDQFITQNLAKPYSSVFSGIVYSQKISIDQKITIAPSIKIGYVTNMLKSGSAYYTHLKNQSLLNAKVSYLDISTGIVINTGKIYAGFAIDHINKPKIPGHETSATPFQKKPVYIYQAGYTYQRSPDSKLTVSSNILIAKQHSTTYTASIVNVSCKYKWLSVGLSSSSGAGDMLTSMFGFHTKNLIIGYSKNLITRQADNTTISTHEVSLRYLFGFNKSK